MPAATTRGNDCPVSLGPGPRRRGHTGVSLVIRPLAEGSHPDPPPLSVPLSWAVSLSSPPAPSGPSWRPEAFSHFSVSLPIGPPMRGRGIGPVIRRIFIIFIFLPQPFPPFLYSLTAPRPSSKQSQQAVSTDQHQSHSQPPQNPVSKVFSRIIWGGGPFAALKRPRGSRGTKPLPQPRPLGLSSGASQPTRSCSLCRPWPPQPPLLGRAPCQPARPLDPGSRMSNSRCRFPGAGSVALGLGAARSGRPGCAGPISGTFLPVEHLDGRGSDPSALFRVYSRPKDREGPSHHLQPGPRAHPGLAMCPSHCPSTHRWSRWPGASSRWEGGLQGVLVPPALA